jgi:hypothetical protein
MMRIIAAFTSFLMLIAVERAALAGKFTYFHGPVSGSSSLPPFFVPGPPGSIDFRVVGFSLSDRC